MLSFRRFLVALALLFVAVPASAEDGKTPYWASIRADELNMRVGPGEDYKILWVYHRPHLPLKVLRMKEGWRFVEDPDGARGWVMSRFLTRERTAFVKAKAPVAMREAGSADARLLWRLAPGVVGGLGDCSGGWCQFSVGPRKGFVEQSWLWGAGEP